MRQTFKTEVLQRFMPAREFAALERRYNENLKSGGRSSYEPTDEHWRIFREWLKDKVTISQAEVMMNCTDNTVKARFARMAKISLTS